MWTYAKTNWVREYFTPLAYNRIADNLRYLTELAFQLYEPWALEAIPRLDGRSIYVAPVFNAIEDTVKGLMKHTLQPEGAQAPKHLVANGKTWDYQDVNRIEETAFLFHGILEAQKRNRKTLQFTLGGDYFG